MLVCPYLTKFFLGFVPPRNGRQQAGISPSTFFVRKELGIRLSFESDTNIPAMSPFGLLIDTSDVLVFFQQYLLFFLVFHSTFSFGFNLLLMYFCFVTKRANDPNHPLFRQNSLKPFVAL